MKFRIPALGPFALSESSLYTTDAMRDYLEHLTDDGVVAFTRWGLEPPRESLRLVALAVAALRAMGKSDPARHIVVARDQGPGIPDVARAMQYGYSTAKGLGVGLPGAKWLMDEFDIESKVGVGTTVTMTKWLHRHAKRPRHLAADD